MTARVHRITSLKAPSVGRFFDYTWLCILSTQEKPIKELANSRMTDDPEYTRQTITIKKTTYEKIRQIAKKDYARRLKIGDVIDAVIESLDFFASSQAAFDHEIEKLRDKVKPPTAKELQRRLDALKK